MNFQMFKLDLDKADKAEIKLPTSIGSSKKQESSRKTATSAVLTIPKSSDYVEKKQTVENSSRDGNTRLPYLPLEKPACRSRSKNQNRTWINRLDKNWESST